MTKVYVFLDALGREPAVATGAVLAEVRVEVPEDLRRQRVEADGADARDHALQGEVGVPAPRGRRERRRLVGDQPLLQELAHRLTSCLCGRRRSAAREELVERGLGFLAGLEAVPPLLAASARRRIRSQVHDEAPRRPAGALVAIDAASHKRSVPESCDTFVTQSRSRLEAATAHPL